MLNPRIYYTPPPNGCFNELKKEAIKLWKTHDNTYGYVDEKVERIERIQNVSDNFMYIVAMFDNNHHTKLAQLLTEDTRKEIRVRMVDGGMPSYLIPF